jgi:ABC-type amino acid transport substrate-binding protein
VPDELTNQDQEEISDEDSSQLEAERVSELELGSIPDLAKSPGLAATSDNEEDLEHKPELQQPPPPPLPQEAATPPVSGTDVAPEVVTAAPDIAAIMKRGELLVGICPIDQPPFHVKGKDGKITGFDVDLAKGIAAALKVTLKLVEVPDWEQTIVYLLEGKIDLIISNLTATPERASKILCSIPYARIRQCILLNRVLVARAAGKNCLTLRQIFSNFENRSILAQEGTSYVSMASTLFPKAKVLATPQWKDIISRILAKEVIGTISDEVEIKEQLKSVQTMELLPLVLKKKFDRIVVGVSRWAPQLLHFVNNYIETYNVECVLE